MREKNATDSQDKLQKREKELGHDTELITKLYTQTKHAKTTVDALPNIVDRIEQKSKVHDMAAKILLSIENMEQQQQNILKSAAVENKEVLETLQRGMKENAEIIKRNVAHLKAKLGIKVKAEDEVK